MINNILYLVISLCSVKVYNTAMLDDYLQAQIVGDTKCNLRYWDFQPFLQKPSKPRKCNILARFFSKLQTNFYVVLIY